MKIKFIKKFVYDALPPTGKITVTIKKGTTKDIPKGAAKNLIRKGIAKEV